MVWSNQLDEKEEMVAARSKSFEGKVLPLAGEYVAAIERIARPVPHHL